MSTTAKYAIGFAVVAALVILAAGTHDVAATVSIDDSGVTVTPANTNAANSGTP